LRWTFIEGDTSPLHRTQKIFDSAFDVSCAIGIFDAKYIHTIVMPSV
jgi:hypothetical protein